MQIVKGLFVTGTDTHVGKTWVGKQLISAWVHHGIDVVPRKPVESGWVDDGKGSDAWALAKAAHKTKTLDAICPNRFKAPVSPVLAASLEDRTLSLASLVPQCLQDVKEEQFLYVEGAGGFYSPLCQDGLNADLAMSLGLPVLLVVGNRLGCLNHALLTIEAIENNGLELMAVVLNSSVSDRNETQARMNNLEELKTLTNHPIFETRYDDRARVDKLADYVITAYELT